MIYWIAYSLLRIASWIFSPITVIGRKNIPRRGSCLLASNHLSNIDPMLIGLCFYRRIGYVAKASLFRKPVFAFFLRGFGAFPIKRETGDIGALREALRRLKAGEPVVVFPTGTRQRSGSRPTDGQGFPGIGFLAVKSGVPVVPVRISWSDKVMPPGSRGLKRHRVVITFGSPRTYTKDRSYEEIAADALEKISRLPQPVLPHP